ncbi:MAG: alpha-glucosidase [Candidatus Niameybacter stercoravium]|nr:alpha-glucosidase [Candidatus Niameybacter stercoravium]
MTKWKEKVIYQIWPRSFYDSNGDGIGDLQGIIQKLDYLKQLGVDVIWLSPIYKSSNKDYGYDISDYYQINPEFGTMEDFEHLLIQAKSRDMGIIMDLVANHTSDEHIWFQSALESKESPYRDFYIFRDGKDNGPPNNWMSFFGGSSWSYDEKSGQYYMTQFTPNQCDLNWENEQMREEIYRVMRFWLDKGVVGFRMDVINAISKADGLPDKSPGKKGLQFPGELTLNRPKTHEYMHEMYDRVLSNYDCMAVGEGALAGPEDVIKYTKADREELQMMFQFDLHNLGYGELGKYDFRKLYYSNIKEFKEIINTWQLHMEKRGGWLGNYLSNHDQRRHVSRFGDDKTYRRESAKALCMLNFTLRGTPFIYQGEEIGMTDCPFEEEDWRDYEAMNAFKVLQDMMHVPKFIARQIVNKVTRDNSRTPVQWDDTEAAGFTTGTPWIKVNPNYKRINVELERAHPDSIFKFYQRMISFYKLHPVLTWGHFRPILENHPKVIGYIRENKKEKFLILINLSKKETFIDLGNKQLSDRQLVMYTARDGEASIIDKGRLNLKPFEGLIYQLV